MPYGDDDWDELDESEETDEKDFRPSQRSYRAPSYEHNESDDPADQDKDFEYDDDGTGPSYDSSSGELDILP